MSSLNKATLIGHLGADPEIRHTQNGDAIANLRLATTEKWTNKHTGDKHERTEWHRVVIFNSGLCKVVEKYLKKGSKIYVEGQIQTRKWQDQNGVDKYSTEIVLKAYGGVLIMLGGGGKKSDDGYSSYGNNTPQRQAAAVNVPDDDDDDTPF